jgi:nucleolar GTP-binding protein
MDVMPEIMDGKNIADFIDPDITEKLEALEREEEKLHAEGFYDSDENIVRISFFFVSHTDSHFRQLDSDDEREEQASKIALTHKLKSQLLKKSNKNQSRLPRTAGLRTLTELTSELSKAGLDPSRIQERAEMIAKVRGAKRKREEAAGDDADMDVDDVDGGDEGEWMDVDDGESGQRPPSRKRVKGGSGAVTAVNSRAPRTNRQMAGLRDAAVRPFIFSSPFFLLLVP